MCALFVLSKSAITIQSKSVQTKMQNFNDCITKIINQSINQSNMRAAAAAASCGTVNKGGKRIDILLMGVSIRAM